MNILISTILKVIPPVHEGHFLRIPVCFKCPMNSSSIVWLGAECDSLSKTLKMFTLSARVERTVSTAGVFIAKKIAKSAL